MPPQSPPPASPPAPGGDASIPDSHNGPLHAFKRNYLSLLSQVQLIEICLSLDLLVPQHARASVWPADLEAAIQALKSSAAPSTPGPLTAAEVRSPPDLPATDVSPQQAQTHTPGPSVNADGVPPMASLQDDSAAPSQSVQTTTSPAERETSKPPQDSGPLNAGPSTTSSRPHSTVNSPAPRSASVPQPHAPYPYAPYGFVPNVHQQPAYPHTSYYATPPPIPPGYPPHYPYAGYPPPPGYPSTPSVHPAYPSAGSPPPGSMGEQPPPNAGYPPMPPAEDLPSYEEMIVEALMDTGDPEGAAPKDLFAWMAARYPLQTNFRPSASQALQKAFKRGRLEKRPGGKYRLNPSWEGGTTSKRTTRKPQTLAQTTYAMQHPPQPPSSPFTNAPLHHRSNHVPYHQPQGQYSGYPYGYPPPGYPQYSTSGLPPYYQQPGHQSTIASKTPATSSASATSASNAPAAAAASKDGVDKGHTAEGHDANAWEAAQHILQAINFSSLHRIEDQEQSEAPAATTSPTSSGPAVSVTETHASPESSAPRTTLTEDERASLQAQLALLAAQLTEIVNGSDGEEDEEEVVPAAPPVPEPSASEDVQMQLASSPNAQSESAAVAVPESGHLIQDLSSEAAGRAMAMLLDNLDSAAQTMAQEEEESDDDDDMEMVEVPTYVESDVLRT